ncbi:hypothetical protein PR202_gb21127 [Eleusine coracana subsp. coracana]|uniref:X8 domain-containing protein n=1 Tax=Eleusine coracana subsp. coracana TaxID=191504 RepID=A0AAV5FED0_ELECO|nr:hypothetical protein PR202_gb21127 [Eleusine coracana subsp. coracana]
MALARFLIVLLGVPLLLFSFAEAGEVGVCYGRVANDLPQDQAQVAKLLTDNGITMVRIYDTDRDVLLSLANTGIKVMVMLPNNDLASGAASNPSSALDWVRNNVAAYLPATKITAIAVGNEVFVERPDLNSQLVQFMTNVQAALAQLGLADTVKVTTPIAFSAVTDTFPPSNGRFVDDVAESVMRPMLQFLQQTGSSLAINLYPYIAELDNPTQVRDDYALGNYVAGVPADGVTYHSLLDAELDATYAAMAKLGFPGSRRRLLSSGVNIYVTETGRSSRRGVHGGRRLLADGDGGDVISVANAQTYNNYVINRVLAGNTGTPQHPDADMDVFIFALFNENGKPGGELEQNFGLFYPNMTKVYQFDFHGGAPTQTWCVANPAVGDARLQAALDFACGQDGADCSAIQAGATCFWPNTKAAHASYAFNDYYQRNGRAPGTCDFAGAASIVNKAPAEIDICWSWCVANDAGDVRLQAALDFACGNGADCSAIQRGAKCFQPDTKLDHATYALNSYYQNKGRAAGTCDFNGVGSVVFQPQSEFTLLRRLLLQCPYIHCS